MNPGFASGNERALVLGGGGSTGNAWLIGVMAGLAEAEVDVTRADLIIGTSAGSTAAAQVSGASPRELLSAILEAATPGQGSPMGAPGGRPPMRPVVDHLERMRRLIASSADVADMRRRVGAAAMEMDSGDGSWQSQWRETVASRLPRLDWPLRRLALTAIDAQSGEPVVFSRDSGVDLADAVAASCSSGRPYAIGARRYLDGGFRSNADNADVAAGHARVLVLAPFSGQSLTPATWGNHLTTQVEALREGGSLVETVFPESTAEHLFGANAMNGALRPEAAKAGYEQGRALGGRLLTFWG